MATKKTTKAEASAKAEGAADVESVALDSHYSFYDDEGTHHQWQEGQVVTDPDQIAVLIERQAPVTVKEST